MLKAALRIASATALVTATLAIGAPADASADPYPGTPEQIRDTGPCGRTGAYRERDWVRTTTNIGLRQQVNLASVREDWYWRHDDNLLWRGDTRQDPSAIFRNGFTPLGTELTPLPRWIIGGGGQNSAHVSTSCERWVAQGFATSNGVDGWVYAIQAPGGIDINATARQTGIESQYLWNKEIDFPGGIKGRYIQGACQYHWAGRDPQTNRNIYQNLGCRTNPGFNPGRLNQVPRPNQVPQQQNNQAPQLNQPPRQQNQMPQANEGGWRPSQPSQANQGGSRPGQVPQANQGASRPNQVPQANQGGWRPSQPSQANQGGSRPNQVPQMNQGGSRPNEMPQANQGGSRPNQPSQTNQGAWRPNQPSQTNLVSPR
ncbi:hypothetical protein [Streptomyces sp. NPDC047108]|uniref:scabin-related ADP-ribosyltransferase n=1 Tax=Streptomyces sp. NPDC047108 TaxID=3155025 RepID=UPI0034005D5C